MQLFSSIALAIAICGMAASGSAIDHPEYASLASLNEEQLAAYERSFKVVGAQPIPPPPTDTSFKLVHDRQHPYRKARAGDQRGPCPGLNTLASHGYLPRTGIATPAQIVDAVMEGLNMEYNVALIATYGAMLVDGNHLTNLLSIGGRSVLLGPSPPPPAQAAGLNVHGTFEGDASITRSDDFLGNNHELNTTLFNQLIDTMDKFGGGRYNIHSAAEIRWMRIQDSIARNPTFDLGIPRYATAYAEATFPLAFFSNASEPDLEVGTSADNIRSFFVEHKFPKGFHRRGTPFKPIGTIITSLMNAHPIVPGGNNGSVNSYTPIEGEPLSDCAVYNKFVHITITLYPNPKGALRKALAQNLNNFFQPFKIGCTELVPYN